MNIYELVKKRRSIRSYKPDPVEEEKLTKILGSCSICSSAANRQPIYFIIIKDEKLSYN